MKKRVYPHLIFIIFFCTSLHTFAQEVELRNRWIYQPLESKNSGPQLGSGSINVTWRIVPLADGYVHLLNVDNGKYLHSEYGLDAGPIEQGWWSAQWKLEPINNGYYRIKNRWRNTYLHVENRKLELGEIKPGWHSAQWQLAQAKQYKPYIFSMVVMSDPQNDFCEYSTCKNGPGTNLQANKWHSEAIGKLIDDDTDIKGVIVNGDLTNVAAEEQLEVFKKYYADKFKVYPGLGNHDYQNYWDKWCDVEKYNCTVDMLEYIEDTVVDDLHLSSNFHYKETSTLKEGSWSYYWDIENVRFVQLNNFPTFQLSFNPAMHKRHNVIPSLSWLKGVLDSARKDEKVVVLNMHGINVSDIFSANAEDSCDTCEISPAQGYKYFQYLLHYYPEVKVIFAGHIHEIAGFHSTVETMPLTSNVPSINRLIGLVPPDGDFKIREVPVYFSGSAMYNLLLKVKFGNQSLWVEVYKTNDGEPQKIEGTQRPQVRYSPCVEC